MIGDSSANNFLVPLHSLNINLRTEGFERERQTDRQGDRQTDRETDRQAYRQTETDKEGERERSKYK